MVSNTYYGLLGETTTVEWNSNGCGFQNASETAHDGWEEIHVLT